MEIWMKIKERMENKTNSAEENVDEGNKNIKNSKLDNIWESQKSFFIPMCLIKFHMIDCKVSKYVPFREWLGTDPRWICFKSIIFRESRISLEIRGKKRKKENKRGNNIKKRVKKEKKMRRKREGRREI